MSTTKEQVPEPIKHPLSEQERDHCLRRQRAIYEAQQQLLGVLQYICEVRGITGNVRLSEDGTCIVQEPPANGR